MNNGSSIGLRPVVSWPRAVQPGRNYLITVDLAFELPAAWSYDQEEYAVTCLIGSTPWCQVQSHGSSILVVHRFGGTYGPVKFVARIREHPTGTPLEPVHLTFITAGGLPFHSIELPMAFEPGAEQPPVDWVIQPSLPDRAPPGPPVTSPDVPELPAKPPLSPAAQALAELIRRKAMLRYRSLRLPHTGVARTVDFEDLYEPPLLRRSRPDETAALVPLGHFAGTHTRLVILGDPGGGKSVALQWLAYQAASGPDQVPVVITLRDFPELGESHQPDDIIRLIATECRNAYNVQARPELLEEFLSTGRALVLFDGLDELLSGTSRRRVADLIDTMAFDYPRVSMVVTARKVGYAEAPLDSAVFDTVELAPLDEARIAGYVRKWFELDESLMQEERQRLADAFLQESGVVPDLLGNPLLLSLMCAMYREQFYIPRNRAELIERCAIMLFDRWDAMRGISIPFQFHGRVRVAVQVLAWAMFESGSTSYLTRSQAHAILSGSFLDRYLDDVEPDTADLFLTFFAGRAWVLTEVGMTVEGEPLYGFTHRTFLEYFAAEHLVRRSRTPSAVGAAIEPRILDPGWDAVGELVTQLLERNFDGGGAEFLRVLLRATSESAEREAAVLSFCARALGLIPSVLSSPLLDELASRCVRLAEIPPANRRGMEGMQLSALRDRPLADLLAYAQPAIDRAIDRELTQARMVLTALGPGRAFVVVYLHCLPGGERLESAQTQLYVEAWSVLHGMSLPQPMLSKPSLIVAAVSRDGPSVLYDSWYLLGQLTPPHALEAFDGVLGGQLGPDEVFSLRDNLRVAAHPWTTAVIQQFAVQAAEELTAVLRNRPIQPYRDCLVLLCLPFFEDIAVRGRSVELSDGPARLWVETRVSADASALDNYSDLLLPRESMSFVRHWAAGDFDLVARGGGRAAVWNIPPSYSDFTGREETLASLGQRLTASKAQIQVLQGIGGVGKTQLAIEYAHRNEDSYDVVWWINAEEAGLIGEQLAALAVQLKLVSTATQVNVAANAVRRRLRQMDRWLLIFDDAEDVRVVRNVQPGGSGHVIITSRIAEGWESRCHVETVEPLTRNESLTLLRRHNPGLDEAEASELASDLGDLPLALAQAASYLTQTHITVAEYHQLLRANATELLQRGTPEPYPHSLAAAVMLAMEQQEQENPAGLGIARLGAFLAPEPIPASWLSDVDSSRVSRARVTADLIQAGDEPRSIASAMSSAGRLGLIAVAGRSFRVHRPVQLIIRDQLSDPDRVALQEYARAVLASHHPGDPEIPDNWADWARMVPHIFAVEPSLGTQEKWCVFVQDASWFMIERGEPVAAQKLAANLWQAWTQTLGPNALDTLGVGQSLARALRENGEFERAEEIYATVVVGSAMTLGETDPLTLRLAHGRAINHYLRGRYQEAYQLQRETWEKFVAVKGEDFLHTLHAANHAANALRELGRPGEARQWHEDTLARYRRTVGDDNPDTLRAASNLALDLHELGDYEQANILQADTLQRRRRVLGESNRYTLESARMLARTFYRLGEFTQAIEIQADTLTRCRSYLGPDHPETLACAIDEAETLHALHDDENARIVAADASERCRVSLGLDHPLSARAAQVHASVAG